jgi:hypothetical protein
LSRLKENRYMQSVVILPLILLWTTMIVGQQPSSSCCRLDVSSGAASPTEFQVAVWNLQETPVVVYRTLPEFDIGIRIVGEDGREPELTDYARQLRDQGRGGSMRMTTLKQGESMAQALDLSKLYVLKKGTYAVMVSRDVLIAEKRIELQSKTNLNVP